MEEIQILDAIERYVRGEMPAEELRSFELLRQSSPEIDQMVVEHTLFLQQLEKFGEAKKFRSALHDTHHNLAANGEIDITEPGKKSRIVFLWNKYKRITAVAASIAGITALTVSALVTHVTPNSEHSDIQYLKGSIDVLGNRTAQIEDRTTQLESEKKHATKPPFAAKVNGTGFLIDNKGLMITNAHVVSSSKNIYVISNSGEQYKAIVLKLDVPRDVAIIKIDDDQFKPLAALPYGIRKEKSDLAEPIFTLGFPREDNSIVYGEGYLSARFGPRGDTLSCQITVAANRGNSGAPVFNHNGEVIGILSSKETDVDGAVFAVQSKYIFQAMNDLQKNQLYKNIKLPTRSHIAGLPKQNQVKQVQDCVFIVKGD